MWGKGSVTYLSDAYALRVRDKTWVKPKLHGKAVVSRWRHATHALSQRQAVFVTGGDDPQGNAVFDPQLLDISGGANGPVSHFPQNPCTHT